MNSTYFDMNAVVLAALRLPAGPERLAYLDGACTANLTFRRQVEALLGEHPAAPPSRRPTPPSNYPEANVSRRFPTLLQDPDDH